MEQNAKDTAFLDVLRWMATIAVVFYHVLNAALATATEADMVRYHMIATPLRWHVPVFLMISGALFLDADKEITYKTLFAKYIRRIVLAIIVFGFPMGIIKYYLESRTVDIKLVKNAIMGVITDNTWGHMWYLYLIIIIYLMIPIIRRFLAVADMRDEIYMIAIAFIIAFILNNVSLSYEVPFYFDIPVISYAVVYFLLGHFVLNYIPNSLLVRVMSIAGIVIGLALVWCNQIFGWGLHNGTNSPIIMLLTVSIFTCVKTLNPHVDIFGKTRNLSFGVYLTHMFFVNLAYKALDISPWDYPLYVAVPLFGLVFFLLGLISSWILSKIPPLRKYVL